MNFLSKLFKRQSTICLPEPTEASSTSFPPEVDVNYEKLEPRQVLSASFLLNIADGDLTLNSFDAGEDFTFTQQDDTIDGNAVTGAYIFQLGGGLNWTGDESATGIELRDGGQTLAVDSALITSDLIIDGANNIAFSQVTTPITVNNLDVSNISATDTAFSLNITGDVIASNIVVAGTSDVDLSITASGTLSASGLSNTNTDAGADVLLSTTGVDGDISLIGAVSSTQGDVSITTVGLNADITTTGNVSVTTGDATVSTTGDNANIVLGGSVAATTGAVSVTSSGSNADVSVNDSLSATDGTVTVTSDDQISLGGSASITTTGTGDILITANADDADSDGADGILSADGAVIAATNGSVTLDVDGTGAGNIALGDVSAGAALTISADGELTDGTVAETANLSATTLNLSAAAIGDGEDIEIAADNLVFNSAGNVEITDVAGGIVITGDSTANGGAIIAQSPLTISANITVAASFAFVASDSAVVGDTITVNNNAVITLDTAVNSTLTFTAGDDIVFDTGTVVTTGGGVHDVILTADNEGALDADRGSVSNSAGATATITTNNLVIRAAEGVGDGAAELRTSVDTVEIVNSVANEVFLRNDQNLVVVGATNANADILIESAGTLDLNGAVDAGTGDVRLIAAGAINQADIGIITANELGVRQTDATASIDVVLDSANVVDEVAINNASDAGVVAFRDADGVTVEEVTNQTAGNINFATTTGIQTNNGDILLDVDGALQIDDLINAGTADVRLVADGNISQGADGQITANELGVRQENAAAGNVTLDNNANDVDVLAADNAFATGTVVFRDSDGVTVGAVATQTIGNAAFAATSGVTTNNGDVLLDVDGALQIDEAINVGGADVRLVADGDITQGANGQITANELGARQEDAAAGVITLDNNSNDVDVFAASNAFTAGTVALRDSDGITVGTVSNQAIGNANFANTAGITTTDGDVLLDIDGPIQIDQAINAGTGDVRLVAEGDIAQGANGQITANQLGARQEDAAAGNITLDNDNNDVDIFAASNAFNGGTVALRDSDGVTVGSGGTQTIGNASFGLTVGVNTTDGDVLLDVDGALLVNQAINSGTADVRLVADGNITQGATGQITANDLGARQESAAGDIILDNDNNDVDVFAASNSAAAGTVVLRDNDGVTIGSVGVQTIGNATFANTTGVTTNSGDVLLDVDGAIQIDEAINAGTADVRLVSDGDISQAANGIITANELGARQQSGAGNIILDNNSNDVDVFAANNAAAAGTVVLRDVDGVTVDTVAAQTIGNATFANTDGIATNNGDVLLDVDGTLQINQAIDAGTADVRLTADGNIAQGASGQITANELGARQASAAGDILLGNTSNDVDIFAAENLAAGGAIALSDSDEVTIGTVSGQTIGNASFANVAGVTTSNGDILINAGGALQIDEALNAGTADVRLVSDGNMAQGANGQITANELGARQESAAGNITLDNNANNVDVFAASNAGVGGSVALRDVDGVNVGTVANQTLGDATFSNTVGITANDGDVLLDVDGGLQIDQAVNAGAGDVRLVADGDILQGASGSITADELGVRQESTNAAVGDLDANTRLDIILDDSNSISSLAIDNAFDGGVIVFDNTIDMTVAEVAAQTIGNASFGLTVGVTNTFTGAAVAGAGDVDNGDILINSDGAMQINREINAGTADVRLISDGNMVQDQTGVITADELGVRQESTGDIDLCLLNDVSFFAAFNNDGRIEFNNVDDYTVGTITAQTIGNVTFAATTGLTGNGDIFVFSAGALDITTTVNAGANDIRLLASGDITQSAGVLIGNNLGVRQEGTVLDALEDPDGNNRYDILLSGLNQVNGFAAFNAFDGGVVVFNNGDGVTPQNLTITEVAADTFCFVPFATTTGIVTTSTTAAVQGAGDSDVGDVLIQTSGALEVNEQINAGGGNADVRLVANGDMHQGADGDITANELGLRQESAAFAAAQDLGADGGYDIRFGADNNVDFLAAANTFDSAADAGSETGVLVFSNVDDLTVDEISLQTIDGISFNTTTGLTTVFTGGVVTGAADVADGDILVSTGGFLRLNEGLTAGAGNADIRLVVNGDIDQPATGVLTANELGVRQADTVLDANDDLDSNSRFDIHLCFNDIDVFGAENSFANGEIVFEDTDVYTIAEISVQSIGGVTYAATSGVVTANGDVLLNSAAGLQINGGINSGTANVRIAANGNITQGTAGEITANQLGVRQENIAVGDICSTIRKITLPNSRL